MPSSKFSENRDLLVAQLEFQLQKPLTNPLLGGDIHVCTFILSSFLTKLGLERINRKIYELQAHVVEIKIFAAGLIRLLRN